MGRFSDMTKVGYNKKIIENAHLKKGDRVKLDESNRSAWFISADDAGITVDYEDKDGKYPVRRLYDDFNMRGKQGEHSGILTGIDGIPAEVISVYSTNPSLYCNYNDTYDHLLNKLINAGIKKRALTDLLELSAPHTVVLLELAQPMEFPEAEQWPSSGLHEGGLNDSILPDFMKAYGLLAFIKDISFTSDLSEITLASDPLLTSLHEKLASEYDLISYFPTPTEEIVIPTNTIVTLYSLAGLEGVAPVMAKSVAAERALRAPLKDEASNPTGAEEEVIELPFAPLQWGQSFDRFVDDLLPDMTGFEPATLGAGRHLWNSPGFLLADRDLQVGECVKAWAVDTRNGCVLKCVHFTADKGNLAKEAWPTALLSAINLAPVDAKGNKWLDAGYLTEVGNLDITKVGLRTAGLLKKTPADKRSLDRLWHYADGCRLITNAPFQANQVIAGHLPDLPPAQGDIVSVQVRDRTTLRLYETHLYKPGVVKGANASDWPKGLCEVINGRHLAVTSAYGMLRAGALGSDRVTIEAAASGNALWIPQNSNLSVEIDALAWRKHHSVSAFTPRAGEVIKFYYFDQYSSTQLPGSPFCYTVPQSDRSAEQCLSSIAAALKASDLGDYLRLGDSHSPDDRPSSILDWHLWVMPLPARVIVQGLPGLAEHYEPALETPEGESLTLEQLYNGYKEGLSLMLRERWNGQVVNSWTFQPDTEQVDDLGLWVQGLAATFDEPLALWGIAETLSPQPERELHRLSAHTLWLPQGLQSVITAERASLAPTPSINAIPDLHPEFTYLRDYLMWEEAEKYAQLKPEENAYVTNYHKYFSAIIALGEAPLTPRDRKEVKNRPHSEFTRQLIERPNFGFYIPSANVPALVASRLSQRDAHYPQKDVWQLRMTSSPPHYTSAMNSYQRHWTECISSNEYQLVIAFSEPKDDAPLSAVSSEYLHLQLTPSVIDKGVRFISYTSDFAPDLPPDCRTALGGFRLYIPTSCDLEADEVLCSASRVSRAGITPPRRCLSLEGVRYPQTAFKIHPPFCGRTFTPKDSLCADYANTVGSAVYDVSGASENGVDPKTGLFHAHYPIGIICGLSGKGPQIDLTLHYSATRANESALGDGWALRFSAYDNRLHRLTLHTGQTITLTADHIQSAKGAKRLAISGVTLTGATGNYASLTGLKVILPSGRMETLAKPSPHDGQEASEDYKHAFIRKLQKIKENLQQWLKESGLTTEQTTNFNDKITDIEKLEKEMNRKALMLVPTSITSPQGGTLTLAWESKRGHVRLNSIADGDIQLLTANHETPKATGTYSSSFTVWPGTDEQYTVTLKIEDCLLTQLQRQGKNEANPVQTVVFGYEGEPVLDRVLCSVAEEDGSLEYVSYAPMWKHWDTSTTLIPLSRVLRHTLLPGAGQQPITHIWEWEGKNSGFGMSEGDSFTATRSLETGSRLLGPSTRRTWQLINGLLVETKVVVTTPGLSRETTEMTYPDAITSTDATVIYRLATQPICTTVTTEDLRSSTINPAAQGNTTDDSVVESQS
ncbi:hypothetical protein [Pseudomonas sp. URMO17WK12:I11]|uniref:hypothetical protein n=1 Tax=Pseudomonas sp. URMO17WK12:I11 TaxID=1283291 RepID=UPI00119CE138|nr:hypothetical protein [Pseudomonas sp. URMO17WK12:I11]